MRIHLKDPKYLYNKQIYEKNFKEMKLESNSIKNIMKIYSSKIVKKKKKSNDNNSQILDKSDNSKKESKNLIIKLENDFEQKEINKNNLFKVENGKSDNNNELKMDKNNQNSIYSVQNNSLMNCCKLGRELFNNNINSNIINEKFKSINDMLYIFNQGTFNFHHIPQLFLNNYSIDMLSYINTNINTNINVKEERGLSLEENKSIYNILDSEKRYFNIKRNVIQAICLDGKRQIFVFFDKKYDIPSLDKNQYKIRFKLLTDIKCLTMGFCDKKIVEDNMYEFNPKNSKKNKRKSDGKYYITTNKLAWNCNNCHQCKNLKFDGDENIYKKGTIFEFYFKPSECEFEVKLVGKEKPIATFRDVRCLKSKYISPFLIFLKNGEVETTFFY